MTTTSNPRRANGHKRDKLRARILREEDTCGICGNWVDVTLEPGKDDSPEVDEIIPVSLGGDPLDRNNTRLTHRKCNRDRGNGTRKTQPQNWTTNRNWWTHGE